MKMFLELFNNCCPREQKVNAEASRSSSPVRQNNFQCRYKVRNHYVDPFQIRAEQSWGVQDNTGQNWPADEVRNLKALDEDHVEPVRNREQKSFQRNKQTISDTKLLFSVYIILTSRSDPSLSVRSKTSSVVWKKNHTTKSPSKVHWYRFYKPFKVEH